MPNVYTRRSYTRRSLLLDDGSLLTGVPFFDPERQPDPRGKEVEGLVSNESCPPVLGWKVWMSPEEGDKSANCPPDVIAKEEQCEQGVLPKGGEPRPQMNGKPDIAAEALDNHLSA